MSKRTPDILGELTGATPAAKKSAAKNTKPQSSKATKRQDAKKTKPQKAMNHVQRLQQYSQGEKEKATIYFFSDTIDALDMAQAKSKRTVSKNGAGKRGQVTRSLLVEFAVREWLEDFEKNGQDSKLAKLIAAI